MPLTYITGKRNLSAMITWASRIQDLKDHGLTLAEIGELVGLATSSVGDLATGRTESPRGEAALKLHDLHRQRCKKAAKASAA